MTRPVTSNRVLLVEDRRVGAAAANVMPLRRYRLARLRFDDPPLESDERFEYLKRSHD
jgi:hypothetical protein